APRPQRPARRAQGGAGPHGARDADRGRLDARLHPRARLRGPPAPDGDAAWRATTGRLPDGNAQPRDLLRQGRRPRRHRAGPPRVDGARGEPAAGGSRRRRARRRRRRRLGAAAADRRHHDARGIAGGRALGARAVRPSRRAWLCLPRSVLHAAVPVRRLPAGGAPEPARRLGREGRSGAAAIASALTMRAVLALTLVVLAAAPARAAGTFVSGRHEGRGYALFTPSAPATGPLVVALHGCWQTPEDFALGTRLNVLAERRGLVVVYPAQ